ncbi:c-type cytochrome [Xanthobacter autotrophicus]|uniref:c-type cytochrome n=1 Tax=Xanthobacter autotrophicus TaxID=280 RepID=UPI00372619C9
MGALFIVHMGTPVAAEEVTPKTGEQTYKAVCMACHSPQSSIEAPKLGDRSVWAPLIEEGQHVITAHGFVGVRAMPPRGGNPRLSLEEFGRAVAYMARAAGADWQDPDVNDHLMQRIRHEEHKRRSENKD